VDVAVSDLHLFFYPERSEGAYCYLAFQKRHEDLFMFRQNS
jgi:hypothetical protein